MSDNPDSIPDASYPDWMYVKVVACLEAESQRHPDGYLFYQDTRSDDFVAVWDGREAVTLFFEGLQAVNLPPMLAHAVRSNDKQEIIPFDKSFENQYRVAKQIGDKRYGSECEHRIVRNGVCDTCRRRVR